LSFQFAPALFESLAHDMGWSSASLDHDRIAPLRELAPLTARATVAASGNQSAIEEIGLELVAAVMRLKRRHHCEVAATTARDRARVGDVMRRLEARIEEPHSLANLASIAGLSRYHFLRTFKSVTGITPHQWILRARLRQSAKRLVASRTPITDIALEVGFDDLSNFIRSFRAEFGISPRRYRGTIS
jgi:transcriptional regulator GlxA family with amidase domain